MNNNMPMQNNNPVPMQNGYPAPMPNGYPAPMQNGYPGPMPNGYPAPMQNGYPAPMPNGYPTQMQNGYPAPGGTPYCMKCGAPFGNSNFCPNCGNPRYAPARVKTPNKDFEFTLKCATGFFSAQPMSAVENAGKSKSNMVWGLIGMLECLLIGASVGTVFYKLAFDVLFGAGKLAFAMILAMIVTMVAQFFASSGIAELVFLTSKTRPSFIQIMNVNAVAFIPLAAASVAALIFAFIFPLASIGLLLIGLFVSLIATYFGYQKAAEFTSSPFWLFTAVLAADVISFALLAYATVSVIGGIFVASFSSLF